MAFRAIALVEAAARPMPAGCTALVEAAARPMPAGCTALVEAAARPMPAGRAAASPPESHACRPKGGRGFFQRLTFRPPTALDSRGGFFSPPRTPDDDAGNAPARRQPAFLAGQIKKCRADFGKTAPLRLRDLTILRITQRDVS